MNPQTEDGIMAKSERQVWTEELWMGCLDLDALLRGMTTLTEQTSFQLTERQWLLFISACLQQMQHPFTDERSRQLIEEVESYAEGVRTRTELLGILAHTVNSDNTDNVSEQSKESLSPKKLRSSYAWDAIVALRPLEEQQPEYPLLSSNVAFSSSQAKTEPSGERERQAMFLHDIIGNPFRPAPSISRNLPQAIITLAQSIYQERRFQDLPILADALEEAKYPTAVTIAHCRGNWPHVKGCWVLDALLGDHRRKKAVEKSKSPRGKGRQGQK